MRKVEEILDCKEEDISEIVAIEDSEIKTPWSKESIEKMVKDKNSIFFGFFLSAVIELILLKLLIFNDKDISCVSFLAFSTISLIFSGSIDFTGLFFLENKRASFIILVNSCFNFSFFLFTSS